MPYRDVLQGLLDRAKTDKRRAELEADLHSPPPPHELAYLLRVFHRIRRRKGSSGFGVSPIEWPDIDAFVRNSQMNLAPWEIEIVEDLDDLYVAEKNNPATKEGAS